MLITLEKTVNSIAYFIKKVIRTILYPFFKPESFVSLLTTNYGYFVEAKTILLISSFFFYCQYEAGGSGGFGVASKGTLSQIFDRLKNINFLDALFIAGPYAIGVFGIFRLVAFILSLRNPQRQLLFLMGVHYFSAFIIINFLMYLLFSMSVIINTGSTVMDYLFGFSLFLMPVIGLVGIEISDKILAQVKFWKVFILLCIGIIIYFYNFRFFEKQVNFTKSLVEKEDAIERSLKILDLSLDDSRLHLIAKKINDSTRVIEMNVLLENQNDFPVCIRKSDFITIYTHNKGSILNQKKMIIEKWENGNSPVMLLQPQSIKWVTFTSDTLQKAGRILYDTTKCSLYFDLPHLKTQKNAGLSFLRYKKNIILEEQ